MLSVAHSLTFSTCTGLLELRCYMSAAILPQPDSEAPRVQMSPQEQAQKELWIKQTVEKAMEPPAKSRSRKDSRELD